MGKLIHAGCSFDSILSADWLWTASSSRSSEVDCRWNRKRITGGALKYGAQRGRAPYWCRRNRKVDGGGTNGRPKARYIAHPAVVLDQPWSLFSPLSLFFFPFFFPLFSLKREILRRHQRQLYFHERDDAHRVDFQPSTLKPFRCGQLRLSLSLSRSSRSKPSRNEY